MKRLISYTLQRKFQLAKFGKGEILPTNFGKGRILPTNLGRGEILHTKFGNWPPHYAHWQGKFYRSGKQPPHYPTLTNGLPTPNAPCHFINPTEYNYTQNGNTTEYTTPPLGEIQERLGPQHPDIRDNSSALLKLEGHRPITIHQALIPTTQTYQPRHNPRRFIPARKSSPEPVLIPTAPQRNPSTHDSLPNPSSLRGHHTHSPTAPRGQ